MPIRIECDGGCGTTADSEADFVIMGHFKRGSYCTLCAESVTAFNSKRDGLHDAVAKKWEAGLGKLKASWLKEHEGGRLPDD